MADSRNGLRRNRTQSQRFSVAYLSKKRGKLGPQHSMGSENDPPGAIGDKPHMAFQLSYPFPIKQLSFSQRRFLGFRNRYEFDKKRVTIASRRDFVVVGYDAHERVYELIRSFVSVDEELRFVSFLEDHVPSFLLLIAYNSRTQSSVFRIMKLRKNHDYEEAHHLEESKDFIAGRIMQNLQQGNFKKRQRKSFENMELTPATATVNKNLFPNPRE